MVNEFNAPDHCMPMSARELDIRASWWARTHPRYVGRYETQRLLARIATARSRAYLLEEAMWAIQGRTHMRWIAKRNAGMGLRPMCGFCGFNAVAMRCLECGKEVCRPCAEYRCEDRPPLN